MEPTQLAQSFNYDHWVRLVNADCLDALRLIPTYSVDAVITDPPYNVGVQYSSTDDDRCRNDYERWCSEWFAECRRISKGAIAISVGIGNIAMWCRIHEPSWVMCWYKPGVEGRSPLGVNQWEPVFLYGKVRGKRSADFYRANNIDYSLNGLHPCPKPTEWSSKLVEMLTMPEDAVLDPFMGSGTVGISCIEMRRRFLGIEIDSGYFDLSTRRIAEASFRCNGALYKGAAPSVRRKLRGAE